MASDILHHLDAAIALVETDNPTELAYLARYRDDVERRCHHFQAQASAVAGAATAAGPCPPHGTQPSLEPVAGITYNDPPFITPQVNKMSDNKTCTCPTVWRPTRAARTMWHSASSTRSAFA